MAETFNRGTGRRKNAVARVRIQPGEGRITVNEKDPLAFLGRRVLELAALAPLRITSTQRKFDVSVRVAGGGTSGQAGAIAHGIARALCNYDPDYRPALKKAGLLTRDARMKERKKYGLKRAPCMSQLEMPEEPSPPLGGDWTGPTVETRATSEASRSQVGRPAAASQCVPTTCRT